MDFSTIKKRRQICLTLEIGTSEKLLNKMKLFSLYQDDPKVHIKPEVLVCRKKGIIWAHTITIITASETLLSAADLSFDALVISRPEICSTTSSFGAERGQYGNARLFLLIAISSSARPVLYRELWILDKLKTILISASRKAFY